jgi:hypothetical protein
VRQAPYQLRHAISPFCSGYFGDRSSLFAQAGLDGGPLILSFLPLLGLQVHVTMPSFVPLRWGLVNVFLPGLT